MNIQEAKNLIKTTFKAQIETGVRFAIEFQSAPGIGKSSMVRQVCEELTQEWDQPVMCKTEFLSTREQPDVAGYGIPSKDTDGTPIMVRTRAPWMPRAEEPAYGILLLDEFGQASADVVKPAAELLHAGRVGESQLPITWMVLAASNREQDRSGVKRQMAFIENRRMLINITANIDVWTTWAEKENVHPLAIAFAKFKPGVVMTDAVPAKSGPYCTPRTLVQVSHLIDKLDMAAFTEAAQGYIGDGAGAELVSFLRVAAELPSFEEIIENPTKARLPTRPDATYAAVQMIVHRIDDDSVDAAFKYLLRLPTEFQVSGVASAMRRCPGVLRGGKIGPELSKWLADHKMLVMATNQMSVRK